MASAFLALGLTLALGLVGVLWQWRRAERGQAEARGNLYVAEMNLALQAWEGGKLERTRLTGSDLIRLVGNRWSPALPEGALREGRLVGESGTSDSPQLPTKPVKYIFKGF